MDTLPSSRTPPAIHDLPPQRAAVLEFLRRELAAGRAPSLAEVAPQALTLAALAAVFGALWLWRGDERRRA